MIKKALLITITMTIILSGCGKTASIKRGAENMLNAASGTVTLPAEDTTAIQKTEEASTEAAAGKNEETVSEPVTEASKENETVTEPAKENTTTQTEAAPPAEEEMPPMATPTVTEPQTQSPTKAPAVTEAPAVPKETETPTTAPVQTEAATTAPVPTEPQTEAPTETEPETVNLAIAERDAFIEKWYHEAYAYPWDFEYIEAELRAYGESLGMTYYDETLFKNDWQNSEYIQQYFTEEEWIEFCTLTPETANWHWPEMLSSGDSIYITACNRENLFAELDYHGARNTNALRIYFELSDDGQHCKVYILY